MLLTDYSYELVNIFCLPSSTDFNAIVTLGQDIAPVMPFLNAVVRGANFAGDAEVLDFMYEGHIVSLRAREMKVTGLADHEHAQRVIEDLRRLVNETWDRRDEIQPRFEHVRRPGALEVLRHLPRTNCGGCGVPTCLAFAALVATDPTALERCPDLALPDRAGSLVRLRELLGA